MPIPEWIRRFPKSLQKKQRYNKLGRKENLPEKVLHSANTEADVLEGSHVISTSEEDLREFLQENRFYKPEDHFFTLIHLPDELLLRIVSYISPLEETFKNLRFTCRRLRAITDDLSLYPYRHLRIPPYTIFYFSTLRVILEVSRKTLSSLDVSDCEDVNDYALFRLVCNLDKLVELNVSGCKQLTNAAMRVVGNYCSKLEWLDFSRCPLITCAGVLQLFQCLGTILKHVNMSNCLGIRKDPHKLTSVSKHFTALRHLAVGWSRDLVKLNPLLDMDLDRLTKGCSQLTFLDISYSHSTNTSMATITTNCPLLETLLAKQCFLQDSGLQFIGNGLSNLKQLDLTDCWYVTDAGLEYIALGCNHLESINLTRCYEVRGNGTVLLTSHCKLLTSVTLKQCFRIDDQAIKYVGLGNPKLSHLDISYNMNVTMDTVRMIRRIRPQIQMVTEGCPGVSYFGSKSRFHFFQVDLKQMPIEVVKETAV